MVEKFWNIPVSKGIDEILEEAVESDAHVSKAEYIREAVRRQLEIDGFYRVEEEDKNAD